MEVDWLCSKKYWAADPSPDAAAAPLVWAAVPVLLLLPSFPLVFPSLSSTHSLPLPLSKGAS